MKACFLWFCKFSLIAFFLVGFSTAALVYYLNSRLPSVEALADVQLQVPLRVYTADQKLMAEFGEKRRTPTSVEQVPEKLIQAILATEDRRFYEHSGVDMRGLLRAAAHLLLHGKLEQGGSTITMQVARNFFLSPEKTFARKLNEILLAFRIEQELPKNKILELYLNKIYFGKRAYGVVAAAEVYYGLPLNHLSLAQMAMIAGLPQAPSFINPLKNPQAAFKRRHHVLSKMLEHGFISEAEFQEADQSAIGTSYHERSIEAYAPHVAEMVRQELIAKFGEEVYTMGYNVQTTINSTLQTAATHSLRTNLHAYDQRHGYRGPVARLNSKHPPENWPKLLSTYPKIGDLKLAVVTEITDTDIEALLVNQKKVRITWPHLQWARKALKEGKVGPILKHPSEILSLGDVIYLEQQNTNTYRLSQAPEANASIVSLSPRDGSILALVGGYEFQNSHFNRATQALRQPGSSFKPFIYCAALLNGFSAASVINDAPIVVDDPHQSQWRPQNDSQKFYGPTRLRVGITKSRNLVSIRLLQTLGLETVISTLESFGFEQLPKALSLALGTSETTVLAMARAYASFANGGQLISPYLIKEIRDPQGHLVYEAKPSIACEACFAYQLAPQIMPPTTAYIMTSMLQDAIKVGTARRALSLKRQDIAGKTGTTQHQMDAWYVGYNPEHSTAVWVGYDEPRSLYEYGAQAALPLWIDFMEAALKGKADVPWHEPAGIISVNIDPESGHLAYPEQKNAIAELFTEETMPRRMRRKDSSKSTQVQLPPPRSEEERAELGPNPDLQQSILESARGEMVDPEALF